MNGMLEIWAGLATGVTSGCSVAFWAGVGTGLVGVRPSVSGTAAAAGVGDGSAPSVVGSSAARSEDGPSVGSSELPHADSSNSSISAEVKIPRKSRGVLIWIHFLCLLGRGGTARADSAPVRYGKTREPRLGVSDKLPLVLAQKRRQAP